MLHQQQYMNNELIIKTSANSTKPFHDNTQRIRERPGMVVADTALPEILLLTSYPPRECGIATYSQDLVKALNNKFTRSFSLKICALEAGTDGHYLYPDEVKYTLNTTDVPQFAALAQSINTDRNIRMVVVQHEFGFFQGASERAFLHFLNSLSKPIILVFHTVLPRPDVAWQLKVWNLSAVCKTIVVMTRNAAKILTETYKVPAEKIAVIAHGTHLVPHLNKAWLKDQYGLTGKKVLATFGLLNSGKSIETTLKALPAIVAQNPDVMFLIIGKTHPSVKKAEGEVYRDMLEQKVKALSLQDHVQFINAYLPLADLLAYLQLTDIYLFTSKDPNQAVSGTFSYALSCGCPIISTPIPHALEVLRAHTGIIFDFEDTQQLSEAVNRLMNDEPLRIQFSESTLQRIVPTAWENAAIAHATLFQQTFPGIVLQYQLPPIQLAHLQKMTTEVGMIQFSNINQPDLESGYTLDDNARALIALCMHREVYDDATHISTIRTYLNFIEFCQQANGKFLNYVDTDRHFTVQNYETNLSDANGRAIWALGYLMSRAALLPEAMILQAHRVLQKALPPLETMHSTRAMAFSIKGLYYSNMIEPSEERTELIRTLANRLVQMYRHESEPDWNWFENSLTYGNSVLPEALLCASEATGDPTYQQIAKTSFDFLLSRTFRQGRIKVISNRTWLQKGGTAENYGEQPIDVAYTILALGQFYQVFQEPQYLHHMQAAFNWFLGHNHLSQIIYNPCTGGCYDGLEETSVNLNQGAESTVSYLMARLCRETFLKRGTQQLLI
jgi:glycosyltransferase involved in cell wall biosynthesis